MIDLLVGTATRSTITRAPVQDNFDWKSQSLRKRMMRRTEHPVVQAPSPTNHDVVPSTEGNGRIREAASFGRVMSMKASASSAGPWHLCCTVPISVGEGRIPPSANAHRVYARTVSYAGCVTLCVPGITHRWGHALR